MTKIHIDTDIGGDIDDLCALAMALKWPGAELTGVTTVAEHVGVDPRVNPDPRTNPDLRVNPKRLAMVRYVLRLAGRGGQGPGRGGQGPGRSDVPVAAGAPATLDCYRSWQGLPDEAVYWPDGLAAHVGASRPSSAVQPNRYGEPGRVSVLDTAEDSPLRLDTSLDLLASSIAQGAVIVAIGPFTNLALLERRSPGILHTARLVLMGGYLYPPRPGYPAWNHEMDWNVQVDVSSALTVFEHAANPTLVPLAVTVETFLRRAYLPRLRQSGPLGMLIARQAEAHAAEYRNEETYGQTSANLPPDIINFQHDPLACAIALGWNEGVELRELTVKSEIRDGWMRQTVDASGRPVRLVTAVDGARFSELWLDVVAKNERE